MKILKIIGVELLNIIIGLITGVLFAIAVKNMTNVVLFWILFIAVGLTVELGCYLLAKTLLKKILR